MGLQHNFCQTLDQIRQSRFLNEIPKIAKHSLQKIHKTHWYLRCLHGETLKRVSLASFRIPSFCFTFALKVMFAKTQPIQERPQQKEPIDQSNSSSIFCSIRIKKLHLVVFSTNFATNTKCNLNEKNWNDNHKELLFFYFR